MNYMTVKDTAKAWGISEQRIRLLCQQGRVEGAEKVGWVYMIPKNAMKPPRLAKRTGKEIAEKSAQRKKQ